MKLAALLLIAGAAFAQLPRVGSGGGGSGGGSGGTTYWQLSGTGTATLAISAGAAHYAGTVPVIVSASSAATAAITSGTGTIFVNQLYTGTIDVVSNISMGTCTGCTNVVGTSYEVNSCPLGSATVTAGSITAISQVATTAESCNLFPTTVGTGITKTSVGGLDQYSADLPSTVRLRSFGFTFDNGTTALASGGDGGYFTIPAACTISTWDLSAKPNDTATVKVWRRATGTVNPTSSDSITTSGLAISTGGHIHSATVTEFSSTAIAAYDIIAFNLFAVGGTATKVTVSVECDQ